MAGNEKFDPDSLNNIEVGVKSTFDLGSSVVLRTNAAAHYGWFDDVKVAQLILTTIPGTTGTTFVTATTNAAKAIVKGADIDVTAVIADDLEVRANVNYAKNNYTEYDSLDASTGAVIDLSGTPFPNNPKWKYAISATYHLPFDQARFGDISIGADYSYADEHWTAVGGECKALRTAANGYGPLSADGSMACKNCVPAWHNVNAQINWDEPMGYQPLRATLSGTNLTGYDGPTGVGASYNSSGFRPSIRTRRGTSTSRCDTNSDREVNLVTTISDVIPGCRAGAR